MAIRAGAPVDAAPPCALPRAALFHGMLTSGRWSRSAGPAVVVCCEGTDSAPLVKGSPMIDRKAFRTLTSGLYLITSRESDRKVGCVVNTLVQVASAPPTLAVALNKDNVTTAAIDATGRFAATVLSEAAPMELIGDRKSVV